MAGESSIGDAAVRERTGRSWRQWFALLDRWGASAKGHRESARYLHEKQGLSPWWSQTVTVRYELERGLREVHQKSKGFEISVSRTIDARPTEVFDAFTQARHLSRWFTTKARVALKEGGRYSNADGDSGRFRTIRRPDLLRFTWENPRACPGTDVELAIASTADGRAVARLTHRKLASRKDAESMKEGWRWALDSLRSYLETGHPIRHEEWVAGRRRRSR